MTAWQFFFATFHLFSLSPARSSEGLFSIDSLAPSQTSSLDGHAQKHVFDTIEQISRTPDGTRTKTVIFITHRLATARRADKIAMMENGVRILLNNSHFRLDLAYPSSPSSLEPRRDVLVRDR